MQPNPKTLCADRVKQPPRKEKPNPSFDRAKDVNSLYCDGFISVIGDFDDAHRKALFDRPPNSPDNQASSRIS